MKIRFTQWPYGARCAFSTSWDDGYTTDMKVLKILEKHHVLGTFFITSKLVGEAGYLDRQQIRDITKKGHEIGSHGQTHQNLCKLDKEQVLSALITSKVDMEELIGKEIFGFSYPFGYFNKRIKALVKQANYKYARTTKFGSMNYPPKDWFEWNPSLMAKGRGGYRKKLIPKYIRFVNTRAFFMKDFPKDWAEIARYMLISAYKRGGYFQLWGHSRSLCEKDDLKKLDMLLLSASKFSDIWFAKNIDIFRYEMTKRFTSIRINRVGSKRTEISIEINPKIEPTPVTVEIEKPESSMEFGSDHVAIQKRYQDKKLLVTFSPKYY